MKTIIRINFEEKWEQAELPYLTSRCMATKATPKRMPASVRRAKEWAETLEVKESDGKPFTRTLKSIVVDDGFTKTTMWERKEA